MTERPIDLAEIVETMKAAHVALIRGKRFFDLAVRADLRLQIARAERAIAETRKAAA